MKIESTTKSNLNDYYFCAGPMSWLRSPSPMPESSTQGQASSQVEFPDLNDADPILNDFNPTLDDSDPASNDVDAASNDVDAASNDVDDTKMGEMQGDDVLGRIYKKGPWSTSNLMVMLSLRKDDWFNP